MSMSHDGTPIQPAHPQYVQPEPLPAQPQLPYGQQAMPQYGQPVQPPQFGQPAPPQQFGQPASPQAQPHQPPHGYPAPQPGYGAQPGYATGATGTMAVMIQGNVMSSNMITPSIRIDGLLMPSQYGMNVFQVPAGRRTVTMSSQWMREFGRGQLSVDVPAGMQAPLIYYRSPMIQFIDGNIGFEPQKAGGKVAFWLIMAAALATPIAIMTAMILNS